MEKKETKTALSIPFYGLNGEVEKTVEVSKSMFGFEGSSEAAMRYIRVFQTNQRQGTASTKTRAEVAGSTRKIYKQKGTGKARHGSLKAPIFKGGGIVGGPKPKEYALRLNKKQKRTVFFYVLSEQLKDKNIFGLGESAVKETKTKNVASFFEKMKVNEKNVLCILPKLDTDFLRAVRNIPYVTCKRVEEVNAYDVLSHKKVVFVASALPMLEQLLNK